MASNLESMKSLLFDSISMAVVALLLFLYLGTGLAAMLVFVFGLLGIRQARRIASKRKPNINRELDSYGKKGNVHK